VFSGGNTSNRSANPVIIGAVTYPATLPNVIAVGAINRNGQVTNYSPEGTQLDVVAPSGHVTNRCVGDVHTTDRWGNPGCNDGGPNGNDINFTSTFSGTSAAAPQVAAAVALLLSNGPFMTWSNVRSRVSQASVPWGPSIRFGAGKLDIDRMLWPYNPVGANVTGVELITQKGTYTWQSNPTGGSGAYAYQWKLRNLPSGTVENLGTQPSQNRTVYAGTGQFQMIVTVTSVGRSATDTLNVTECIGQPGGCYDP
jgi:subtilisin family serine protease